MTQIQNEQLLKIGQQFLGLLITFVSLINQSWSMFALLINFGL